MPDVRRDPTDETPGGVTVAVIPARGGSKGITRKNLQRVGGQSLVRRAVQTCRSAAGIDLVVVTTDDEEIAAEAVASGATVVERPPELGGDLASSESALLHALDDLGGRGIVVDVVVFVQCTSPFIDPATLDAAIGRLRTGEAESIFAGVPTFEFLWRTGDDGTATGLNHDHRTRPRRQDRLPDWRETGAFYVLDAAGFRSSGHRFFGRIVPQAVDPLTSAEIDEPTDLDAARAVAPLMSVSGGPAWATIRLLVTDFDGVHTDDRVIVHQDGTESVIANRSDGHGVKLLRSIGVEVMVVSTERNPVVARRAEKLAIECLHGLDDKWSALRAWLTDRDIDPASVAFLGNDVNDLDCLGGVGFPLAVADAHSAVRRVAVHVTDRPGGAGAVREIADRILDGVQRTTNNVQEASR